MPLYFAFVILLFKVAWNLDIVVMGNQGWILSNVILSIAFIPVAIWAHRKLSPKNAETKWMNNLLRGNGSQVTAAQVGTKGRTGQLPVGQRKRQIFGPGRHFFQEIVTDLMPKSSGTGMNHDGDLALGKTKTFGH